jgi:hypothetical protein
VYILELEQFENPETLHPQTLYGSCAVHHDHVYWSYNSHAALVLRPRKTPDDVLSPHIPMHHCLVTLRSGHLARPTSQWWADHTSAASDMMKEVFHALFLFATDTFQGIRDTNYHRTRTSHQPTPPLPIPTYFLLRL